MDTTIGFMNMVRVTDRVSAYKWKKMVTVHLSEGSYVPKVDIGKWCQSAIANAAIAKVRYSIGLGLGQG